MNTLEELAKNLIEGQKEKVEELTRQALADGISVGGILDKGLIGSMNVVGECFKQAEMFIPEVLLAAGAMKAAMRVMMLSSFSPIFMAVIGANTLPATIKAIAASKKRMTSLSAILRKPTTRPNMIRIYQTAELVGKNNPATTARMKPTTKATNPSMRITFMTFRNLLNQN